MKVGAIRLRKYLAENGIRSSHFSRAVGKFPSTFSRLLSGESLPDLQTAMDIEKESKGYVTCEHWLKDSPAGK